MSADYALSTLIRTVAKVLEQAATHTGLEMEVVIVARIPGGTHTAVAIANTGDVPADAVGMLEDAIANADDWRDIEETH